MIDTKHVKDIVIKEASSAMVFRLRPSLPSSIEAETSTSR